MPCSEAGVSEGEAAQRANVSPPQILQLIEAVNAAKAARSTRLVGQATPAPSNEGLVLAAAKGGVTGAALGVTVLGLAVASIHLFG